MNRPRACALGAASTHSDTHASNGQALLELALIVPALLILLGGAIDLGRLFYAKITSHSNHGHEEWAYAALIVALVSSFILAVQESVLDSVEGAFQTWLGAPPSDRG